MEISKLVDSGLNNVKNTIQSNNFVYALVYLLLIVYTVQISQNVSTKMMASLVKNSFFKLFIFVIMLGFLPIFYYYN